MQAVEEIVTKCFQGWDQKHISEPVLEVLRELAKDGRFDEMTALLIACVDQHGRYAMRFVLTHVSVVLLNSYIYGRAGASAPVVEEYWQAKDVSTTINNAALKPGRLSLVVTKIVSDLQEMAALSR
ncbi:hypothetical protein [Pseudomonas sp.]|uniref:hypothetical protein n=1 Tax=Pseudomonas sp. TaxID=306 RepID=UPI0028A18F26|nr:hypothetical protein [Pseudomonas sp.]